MRWCRRTPRPRSRRCFAPYLRYAQILGSAHGGAAYRAFATPTEDSAFAAEPLTKRTCSAAADDARHQSESASAGSTAYRAGVVSADVQQLLDLRGECLAAIDRLVASPKGAIKTRIHGDFHLGQVLVGDGDIFIVDFEGEPSRPAAERRTEESRPARRRWDAAFLRLSRRDGGGDVGPGCRTSADRVEARRRKTSASSFRMRSSMPTTTTAKGQPGLDRGSRHSPEPSQAPPLWQGFLRRSPTRPITGRTGSEPRCAAFSSVLEQERLR